MDQSHGVRHAPAVERAPAIVKETFPDNLRMTSFRVLAVCFFATRGEQQAVLLDFELKCANRQLDLGVETTGKHAR